MKFINRKDIDTNKWNERIANDPLENIFCYSWYLDAVAENWGALISDDNYKTILPVPFTSKLGVKHFYPAPFTREYDIFGDDFNWEEALKELETKFAKISFRNRSEKLIQPFTGRKNQELQITEGFESKFRSNAKRLIKKGTKNYHFEQGNEPQILIQLFKETVAHKIDSIKAQDLESLNKLMTTALTLGKGELIFAKDATDKIVAGGFFLKDKSRITYLKGAANESDKKTGVMYALINFAANRYSKNFTLLDFGGSDIEAVATFYKKFGANDREYYNYELDNSPFWFKTLKRIAKK